MAKRTKTDNTMAKRTKTDNTMGKRTKTDNTMGKRKNTDNTMGKRNMTKGQTTIYKTLHRKLKIEQHESIKNRKLNKQWETQNLDMSLLAKGIAPIYSPTHSNYIDKA